MQRLLLAVAVASLLHAAPILEFAPAQREAAPVPAPDVCATPWPRSYAAVAPDCSFAISPATLVREVVLRPHGPFDRRTYPLPARRVYGIPEPLLCAGAGVLLVVRGALRRAPARRPVSAPSRAASANCIGRAA